MDAVAIEFSPSKNMESTPQDDVECTAIVKVLANVLEKIVSANSHLAASRKEETKFDSRQAPEIGILQYLERIQKYASCSKECFILALIYIDRIVQQKNFVVTSVNVHRVVVTAIMLAAKFFDDAYYNNAHYAKVGGVPASEMNALECEFLFMIDFGLRVTPEEFDRYRNELIRHQQQLQVHEIGVIHCQQPEELCNITQAPTTPQAPVPTTICDHASLDPPILDDYASHFPTQAFHRSMMEASQQTHYLTQHHQHASETLPVVPSFPFQPLSQQQVNVQQQQAQDPALNRYDLDFVSMRVAAAASIPRNNVPPSQYAALPETSLSHHHVVTQAPAPSQDAYFREQQTMDDPMMYPTNSTPMVQAPDFSQQGTWNADHYTINNMTTTSGVTPSPPLPLPTHFPYEAHHQMPATCGSSSRVVNFANNNLEAEDDGAMLQVAALEQFARQLAVIQ